MSQTPIPGWTTVEVGEVLTFQVPSDAQEQAVQPIDSIVGIIDGPGYQIVYDYGRFSESLDDYQNRPGFLSQDMRVDGRQARRVSFEDPQDSPERPVVNLLQVAGRGPDSLTLHISCVDVTTCQIVDAVFASVAFH